MICTNQISGYSFSTDAQRFFIMIEEWKPVIGYEWFYEVSSIWRVKSLWFWKERILKPWINNIWRSMVILTKELTNKPFLISRLVWINFIPNTENKPYVLHKIETLDENWALYNWMDNLFWGNQSENMTDMYYKNRSNNHFKLNHPKPHLWKFWKCNHLSKIVYQYTLEWEFLREWINARQIEKELWIKYQYISNCCLWKQKNVGGFTFTYIK